MSLAIKKRTHILGKWLIWGLEMGKYKISLEHLLPVRKCSKNDKDTHTKRSV
jgi:hypothetical protein